MSYRDTIKVQVCEQLVNKGFSYTFSAYISNADFSEGHTNYPYLIVAIWRIIPTKKL